MVTFEQDYTAVRSANVVSLKIMNILRALVKSRIRNQSLLQWKIS